MKKAEELFCAVLVGFLLGLGAFLGLSETIWKRVQISIPYAHVIPTEGTTKGGLRCANF